MAYLQKYLIKSQGAVIGCYGAYSTMHSLNADCGGLSW